MWRPERHLLQPTTQIRRAPSQRCALASTSAGAVLSAAVPGAALPGVIAAFLEAWNSLVEPCVGGGSLGLASTVGLHELLQGVVVVAQHARGTLKLLVQDPVCLAVDSAAQIVRQLEWVLPSTHSPSATTITTMRLTCSATDNSIHRHNGMCERTSNHQCLCAGQARATRLARLQVKETAAWVSDRAGMRAWQANTKGTSMAMCAASHMLCGHTGDTNGETNLGKTSLNTEHTDLHR